ncbi:MAG: hypothetical protein AB3N23_08410 [Paracoccaceae bacterium]
MSTTPQIIIAVGGTLGGIGFLVLARSKGNPIFTTGFSRTVAGIIGGLLLLFVLVELPYLAGLCSGGMDEPISCPALPFLEDDVYFVPAILLMYTSIFVFPFLAGLAILAEAIARLFRYWDARHPD